MLSTVDAITGQPVRRRHIAPRAPTGWLPEHLLWALQIMLEDTGTSISPARWLVRVAGGDAYVLAYDGEHWTLSGGETEHAAVTITTTRQALAKFLSSPPEERDPEQPDLTVEGGSRAVRTLLDAIAVFPLGPGPR